MYFDKPYNRTIFLNLLQSKMFPNFKRMEQRLDFGKSTAYFVENGIYQLGEIELDEKIYVLEVEQKSSNDPRITLTKDAFKILEYHGIDHAIVVFHCKDTDSYRLSLLTVIYENWEKKTSSYKRYSYILGPSEKVKTPERELLHPIKDYEDLRNRFKVEVVRDQFFDEYLELFVRLYKAIQGDKPFVELLESQNVDIVSFTKNLLGKIIFLYFIQQKGRLGLGRNTTTKYGEGNKNFMRILWNNFKNQGESMSTEKTGYFYNDYLEWLFFAGLNVDRRDNDDRFPNLQMKVPYLNGGLFKEEYTGWESYVTKIDNKIFSNIDEKGEDDSDGILDIFDRYNFTIDEDSLYDRDIAVDPEMLGRIFEKMISISTDNIDDVLEIYDSKSKNSKIDFGKELNKKLGAFYTPREIVHYMTKETLINYLSININEEESVIRKLFELKEDFLLDKKEIEDIGFSTDFILKCHEALKRIKILDPAVGSGAFPMGLLHEISSLRYYIYGAFFEKFGDEIKDYMVFNEQKDRDVLSLYKIKKDIILNNIYGIDIDPGAINIARLRFWLSLVVDEEKPEPLPNFEFKFVCANSLIPLEDEAKEKDLFSIGDEPKLETLKKYKREYYNSTTKKEKKEIKNKILEYTKVEQGLFGEVSKRARQIEEFGKNFDNPKHSHSFFDSSLMLSEWRGFDIVIGNPPYISYYSRQSQGDNNLEQLIQCFKKNYSFIQDKSKLGRFNTVMFFLEKASKLIKKTGVVNFIIDTNFYSNPFHDIRKYLINNVCIEEIVTNIDVFEGVASKQVIIRFSYSNKENIIWKTINDDKVFEVLGEKEQKSYCDKYELYPPKNEDIYSIYEKLIKEPTFSDLIGKSNIRTCITFTGQKDKFVRNTKEIDIDYPLLEGSKSVTGPYNPIKYYSYIRYDTKLRDKLNQDYVELAANEGKRTPMVIGLGDLEAFKSPKIFIRLSDVRITATYTSDFVCADLSLYVVTFDNKKQIWNNYDILYILGILNSSLITFYARSFDKIKNLGKGTPQIRLKDIRELPIHGINFNDNNEYNLYSKIVELVNKTLSGKETGEDTSDLEKQIDRIVYELYGLTDEEIQIVENSIK